jgi:urease accessory protein
VSCFSRPERIGRDGFLRLVFERRDGRTVLTKRRFTPPLQALEPSRLPDGSLYTMMLNPTGGTFGGDQLRTEIVLGAGTHVVLTTPSATKVYRALDQPARCETEIALGKNAILEYLPDHLIPHPGAALRQRFDVTMEHGSCAIVYDAMAAGRIGRGEHWKFRELSSEVSIRVEGTPQYLSRASLIPASRPLDGLGVMEGFDYLGSIIAIRDRSRTTTEDIKAIDASITSTVGVWGGATALAANGFVAKFLASSAQALNLAMLSSWSAARMQLIGLPRFDLRKL